MTDLLERYLAAVARELPDRQRADITAELRDELLTKIELKEEAAGRPLQREELEAVLLEFGHPLIIAGRYRKVQHLVGPEIFPLWWMGLKATMGIVAAVYIVVVILHFAFTGDGSPLGDDQFPSLVPTLLTAFGAVTLVAVLIERLNLQRVVYRWRPRQLPPAGVKSTAPFERMVEIGMQIVFILWWTGVIHFRIPMGPIHAELGPVFDAWFWPILVYSAGEIAINVLGLLRPAWVQVNAALTLVRSLAVMGICVGLLQAGHWVVVSAPDLFPSVGDSVQANFDLGVKIGLVITVAGMAIKAFFDAYRLWRVTRDARTPFSARAA